MFNINIPRETAKPSVKQFISTQTHFILFSNYIYNEELKISFKEKKLPLALNTCRHKTNFQGW